MDIKDILYVIPEREDVLIIALLSVRLTNFAHGYHNISKMEFSEPDKQLEKYALMSLLEHYGFKSEIYISIAPCINIRRKRVLDVYPSKKDEYGLPDEYGIDLEKFRIGNNTCSHATRHLEWEDGFNYNKVICVKCGKVDSTLSALVSNIETGFDNGYSFIRNLLNKVLKGIL